MGRPTRRASPILLVGFDPAAKITGSSNGSTSAAATRLVLYFNHQCTCLSARFCAGHPQTTLTGPVTHPRRELVVNIISEWFVEAANHCCGNFDYGENEFELSGLHPIPSEKARGFYCLGGGRVSLRRLNA